MEKKFAFFLKKSAVSAFIAFLAIIFGTAVSFLDYKAISASSGTVSLYIKEDRPVVGSEVNLVVDVNSTAGISFVDIELLYDTSLFEFVTADEGVAADNGVIRVSDHFSKNKNRKKYAITFLALKEGSWEFLTTTDPVVYDASFEVMSVSTLRTTVVIAPKEEEQEKPALSYLRVAEGEIAPEFSPENTEYALTVPNEVKNLTIYADSKNDSHQVIIEGNGSLKEGENKVVIKVSDQFGNENSYILSVKRNTLSEDEEAQGEEEPGSNEEGNGENKDDRNEEGGNKGGNKGENKDGKENGGKEGNGDFPELETGKDLKAQVINDRLNLMLSQRFIVVPLPEDVAVPTGYKMTQLIIDGNSLTAYTLEDDLENDFLLFYGKLKGGKSGFYFYDRVEKTLQRYNGNPYLHTGRKMEVMDENGYERKLSVLRVITFVSLGLFVAALMGCLTLILREREKQGLDKK